MDSDLYNASISGNIDVLRQYRDKLDDQVTPGNNTVLHLASRSGKTECVRQILSISPSLLHQVNSRGESALHLAGRGGHSGVVRALINNARSQVEGEIESGGVETTNEMIRMTNVDNDTALHEATRYRHVVVVRMLIEEDPTYSYAANKAGETPLYIAAHKGYHDLVCVILEGCESPTYGGPNRTTALHGAVISNSKKCIGELLEWNINFVKETDANGQTPLHLAAHNGYADIVHELLCGNKSVAYLADQLHDKSTALHIATSQGHTNVMAEILRHCPDCYETVNRSGHNILHIAVQHRKRNVVEFILADSEHTSSLINQKDVNGNAPLHLLVTCYFYVPELINHGMANMEAINDEGLTPLDLAREELKLDGENGTIGGGIATIGKIEKVKMEKYKKVAETHVIVAALIVTVTFAAGFTIPGGYNGNEGLNQGLAILTREAAFKAFIITDTMALLFSTVALVIYLIAVGCESEDKLVRFYGSAAYLILFSIGAMMVAFSTGTYAVLEHSLALAIATCFIGCSFYLFYFVIIRKWWHQPDGLTSLQNKCKNQMPRSAIRLPLEYAVLDNPFRDTYSSLT